MSRILPLLISALTLSACIGEAQAQERVYRGRPERIRDYSWTWRASGSVGFQGVQDPWDQFGVSSFPIGGYASFGIERLVLGPQSLEVFGGYCWVDDRRNVVSLDGPPQLPRPGTYRYAVDAWSAGAMWRFWWPHGGSSTSLGIGGAWVAGSTLEYEEEISGTDPFRMRATGTGPQVTAVFGYEGIPAQKLRVGVELGVRYSWVEFDQGIFGAGNFNGIYLGFRVALVSGG
jgi:hypothetical protein